MAPSLLLSTCSPDFTLEIIRSQSEAPCKIALFDFDGTLSLIREGWQDVMIPYFCEVLGNTGICPNEVEKTVRDFVDILTGKQTIYQCIRLAEEVGKQGGTPLEPLLYKQEYHQRLLERIDHRLMALRSGTVDPDEYVVPGGRAFLTLLRNAGMTLYLASGTDECYVKEEVALLNLEAFFNGGVYGAKDDYKTFSKAQVIEHLIQKNAIKGGELVGFGDGYVEIQNVREVGGYAVGVATDEKARKGIEQWKRQRLLDAGADLIVPDFSDPQMLFDFIVK